jgi:hypothetical protein
MSRRSRSTDFSRIRPARSASTEPEPAAPPDHEGRRALFSGGDDRPDDNGATGSVVVSCGSCGADTVLSPTAALRLAVPSLHLPYLKRGHGSWMRCPACRTHAWVSVQIRLP